MESVYVLFELGARWGAKKHMTPLLGNGGDSKLLKGPLLAINALSCDNAAQLHQLIEDLAKLLGRKLDRPTAYEKCINEVVEGSRQFAAQEEKSRALKTAVSEPREKPRLKWGCYQFEGEEGLFCTACYDTKGLKIQTTRMNSNFRACPVCKARFGS